MDVKIGGDGSNILLDDGTVLPIGNLPSLNLSVTKVYANNAAALTAGESIGTIYWTSTGELRIVI